ncbi:MAG: hypothetical protein ACYC2G_12110 [Gemmatimonadaceae bacterium]
MHRRTLVPLAALAVIAAACSDRAPVSPAEPPARTAAALISTTCDAAGVRLGLNATLADRTTRSRATALFDRGWALDRGGDHVAARASYYAVLNVVIGAWVVRSTDEPPSMGTRQATNGVGGLTGAVYRCAGDVPPTDLGNILAAPPPDDGDHALCTGAGDLSTTCVTPNQRLAVIAGRGFLSAPALFMLQPAATYADPAFEGTYGTQWSRTWRARVLPITAQTNYPTAATGSTVAAVVAVCVADRLIGGQVVEHPSRGLLQVAARAEATPGDAPQLLPVQSLVDGQDVTALLDCEQPGGPTASRGALEVFHAAARRLLSPRPLLAFDGGIGGRVSAFRSYYAAVRPPTARFVFSAAPSSSGTVSPSPVTGGLLMLPAGTMAQLFVSTTGATYTPATDCTWGYRPPDGAGAALLIGDAVLALRAGTTWLRASCGPDIVDLRVVVP